MVHVPAPVSAAVAPETVQTDGVVEAKLTANPELADAIRATWPPTVWAGIAANVMVWVAWLTAKLCDTGVAALNLASPAWDAWMVQVPAATRFAVAPDTVQTAGVVDAKLTANPELAKAVSVTVPPTVWAGMAPNVMVCVAWSTENVWETGSAAEKLASPGWYA